MVVGRTLIITAWRPHGCRRGESEMSILAFTIIAIIVNFIIGFIVAWISKNGCVAIGAAIIADMILFTLYVFL